MDRKIAGTYASIESSKFIYQKNFTFKSAYSGVIRTSFLISLHPNALFKSNTGGVCCCDVPGTSGPKRLEQ